MSLRPVEMSDIPLVAEWLGDPANYQWLDFGRGVQRIDPVALRIMLQRDLHLLRLFNGDDGEARPIGIVGLSDIDRNFGTATLWAVLGEKEYGRRRLTTQALREILSIGFGDLGLSVVDAWTLETNRGGQRILDELNFRFIGRQRSCHVVEGQRYDRLWYDLLAEEHS